MVVHKKYGNRSQNEEGGDIMEVTNSFSKVVAKQLLPYLFHHDPNMEEPEFSDTSEGV